MQSSDEVRRLNDELRNMRRDHESCPATLEREKRRITEEYERKIRNLELTHKQEVDRLKSDLERVNRELEAVQKSKLGQTSYTSGDKRSEFQSPSY